ncbi:MAG: AAA family ATPase [Planctomycetota bacterium]|nr:AAA family ATPase [Planctomycetota bacterium]
MTLDVKELEQQLGQCATTAAALRKRLGERIVGHAEVVELVLTALFAGGHVLLEGVPGIGKTLLVRTLADSLDAAYQRIQFTPDLMPADVTGTTIFHEGPDSARSFQFREGPIFANIVLADEINRATPKTQSALLEAMEERQVTADRVSRPLPDPFMVLATQNPLEMEGTYPLPEAQLDRFLYKIAVPVPSEEELVEIIDRAAGTVTEPTAPVCTAAEAANYTRLAREVVLTEDVRRLIARFVLSTHPESEGSSERVRRCVRYGASPRAALALALGLKVRALMAGRPHVERDDIPALFKPALRHRIALNFEGEAEGLTPDTLLDEVLDSVPLR